MILSDGTNYQPEASDVAGWKEAYRGIDVEAELRAMACWLDANPTRRKTPRGIKRFINSWLQRAQDRGGSPASFSGHGGRRQISATSSRNMSVQDELTDITWVDCPRMKETLKASFLDRYGQYFDGERVTA